ncbi:MAG TPA: tail fiber domain-containing protein [Polyangiaceae bacterium]
MVDCSHAAYNCCIPQAQQMGCNCFTKSDRNLKRNMVPIPPEEVLERLNQVDVPMWSYKEEDPSVRHIGPMAQDFHAAFGLGASERRIDVVDANGVSFAAIQALYRKVQKLEQENQKLRSELQAVERRVP